MAAAIFAEHKSGLQGVMMQMFNHGINIIGLWIVIEVIERRFGARKLSELGGLAQKAPVLTTLLVIVALANISLPLTNAFVGEFLMFNGIFASTVTKYNFVFAALAGLSIILAAVYTLNMIRRVFLGDTNNLTSRAKEVSVNEQLALVVIVLVILISGIYPQPLLNLTESFTDSILREADIRELVRMQ
jgi:NADH-quinone oxidoreductase subunit M